MTTSPHPIQPPSAAAPPPGCPAHAGGAGPVRLLESDVAPQDLYEQLRAAHGPVVPVLLPGDLEAWLVVGYNEILHVLRNPNEFSCDSRNWTAAKDGRLTADNPLLPLTQYQPLIAFTDGEAHARLRDSVVYGLERFNRHGIRRYVTRFANDLIEQVAVRGRADLVADFAEPLPAMVLTRQFGIAAELALPLGRAVRDMVRGTETALASNTFVVETMRDLVRAKRRTPGDDFASWLLAHESALTDVEAEEHLRHALVAGIENTVNLIANTLRVVLTDQRFHGSLSGGSLTLPDALDHVMWEAPPLTLIPNRWAVAPVMLGDQHIRPGDMVLLSLAAGNRDPQVRADLSLPMHGNRSHLAFGGGRHECPGMDIGRTIADTGIDILLAELSGLRLAVPGADLPVEVGFISSPLASLPVEFTPHRAAPAAAGDPAPAAAEPPVRPTAPPVAARPRRSRWGWLTGLLGGRRS
ncbi:cytochrome P450 [Streptomyces sp. NPDC093225]|uniref:cytochrome P450 n=1 Tax=Streptomyces sp. NPDC093225 TaxID=3366034 RepID=UPI003820B277